MIITSISENLEKEKKNNGTSEKNSDTKVDRGCSYDSFENKKILLAGTILKTLRPRPIYAVYRANSNCKCFLPLTQADHLSRALVKVFLKQIIMPATILHFIVSRFSSFLFPKAKYYVVMLYS